MIRRDRRSVVLAGILAVSPISSPRLAGQEPGWRLTATANQNWFSSIVRDTAGSEVTYDFAPTSGVGLAADRTVGRVRVGIGVGYSATHLRITSALVSITDQEYQFRRWQVATLVTVPMLRVGTEGAGLAITAGPALSIWTPAGEDSRGRFSGLASLVLNAPATSGWSLLASVGGAVSGSPLNSDEVPDSFAATTLWTWQVGLGLLHGL